MPSQPFRRWSPAPGSAGARGAPRAASAPPSPARRGAVWRGAVALGAALLPAAALALTACGSGGDGRPDATGASGERAVPADRFDGAAALRLAERQVSFGQRPAGSPALRRLSAELRGLLPRGRFERVPGHPGLRNVVGMLPGPGPALLIAAHYDTEASPRGFVGANDGAAGPAAVIEVARALRRDLRPGHREVRFALFDGEEEPLGCPDSRFADCALRGSKAYAARHQGETGEMVLLDYVGNRGLELRREGNSDPELWERLRQAATAAGVGRRFPEGEQVALLDDHYPFLQRGVPAIDLIDFSYPYRDTVEDTPDKLSAASLDAVGEAVTRLALDLAGGGGSP